MSNKKNKLQTKGVCEMGVTLADRGIGNPDVLAMLLRPTTQVMKDRRSERGGAKNKSREYLSSVDSD
jgi:hypothetical protein